MTNLRICVLAALVLATLLNVGGEAKAQITIGGGKCTYYPHPTDFQGDFIFQEALRYCVAVITEGGIYIGTGEVGGAEPLGWEDMENVIWISPSELKSKLGYKANAAPAAKYQALRRFIAAEAKAGFAEWYGPEAFILPDWPVPAL